MESFLKVFGNITVADIALVISAILFLAGIYKKVGNYLDKLYEEKEKEKEKNKRIQEVLDLSKNYPKWRQQSLDAQRQYNNDISEMKESLKKQEEKIEKIEEDRRVRDKNKLGDKLLQSYQYYASENKNPMRAWTEMEKDAFDKLFKDYENLGGDGYMHTVIQPEMNQLDIIPMHETEHITSLMQSRK